MQADPRPQPWVHEYCRLGTVKSMRESEPSEQRLKSRTQTLIDDRSRNRIGRREFMRQLSALLVSAGLPTVLADPGGAGDESAAADFFWPTIEAVQEHLWPRREGTPALADFNATAYLAAALLDPQIEAGERQYISDGVAPLEAFTRTQFERSFFELEETDREAVLRKVETSPVGQYWLSLIMYYLFEALLTDPVYGGNTDGAGWRWLEHEPGFPRPPSAHPYPESSRA